MDKFIKSLGSHILFLAQLVRLTFKSPPPIESVAQQLWKVFRGSLLTTSFSGFFVGAIIVLQFSDQIKPYGGMGYLGGLVSSSLIREIGPLLIAFMLSGKVGAFTSAELGVMRVTDQLDALRCLGINPLTEIVLPRFIGIILASFFLLTTGMLASMVGGFFAAFNILNLSFFEFIRNIPVLLTGVSILSGLVKCLAFAFLLGLICSYRGYFAEGGARGVGTAVVQTAVTTMVGLVVVDWFTSFLGDIILSVVGVG